MPPARRSKKPKRKTRSRMVTRSDTKRASGNEKFKQKYHYVNKPNHHSMQLRPNFVHFRRSK
jgi:hypothetical protein